MHGDEHAGDVSVVHRRCSTIERYAHGVEPVPERADLGLAEVFGVFAPEPYGVVLPDDHAWVPREGVRVERLEGDAIHRLHEPDESLEHVGDGHEVLSHAPLLDGDVAPPLAQEAFCHEEDEARSLEIHLARGVANVADRQERGERLELARLLHAHPEDVRRGHHRELPFLDLRRVVWIDDEMAAVQPDDCGFRTRDGRNLHGVVFHRATTHATRRLEDGVVNVAEELRARDVLTFGDVVALACLVVVADVDGTEHEGLAGHRGQNVASTTDVAETVVRADCGLLTGTPLGGSSGGDDGKEKSVGSQRILTVEPKGLSWVHPSQIRRFHTLAGFFA